MNNVLPRVIVRLKGPILKAPAGSSGGGGNWNTASRNSIVENVRGVSSSPGSSSSWASSTSPLVDSVVRRSSRSMIASTAAEAFSKIGMDPISPAIGPMIKSTAVVDFWTSLEYPDEIIGTMKTMVPSSR